MHGLDWKTCRGTDVDTRSYEFKADFVRQHGQNYATATVNKHGQPRKLKCIGCPAQLSVYIRKVTKHTTRMHRDLKDFPALVKLRWNHNHVVRSAAVLSSRAVHSDAVAALKDLFSERLGVSEAYADHRSHVKLRHALGDFGDRTI